MVCLTNTLAKRLGFILLGLLISGTTIAAPKGVLPNCYTYAKLDTPNASPEVELFVLIDQTTPLSQNLQLAANFDSAALFDKLNLQNSMSMM